MGRLEDADLSPGDVVAVTLAPGPEWLDLVREIWDAGAVLLPLDPRLPPSGSKAMVRAARPTVTLDPDGWRRLADGVSASADVALIVPTSGTGGVPKLVQLDRAAIEAAVTASAITLEATRQDRWLCCLPLSHVGGLLVLLRSIVLGAPVSVHPTFDPAAVTIEHEAVFTSLVPTMLRRLLDAGIDLTGYRAVLVGGAALAPELRSRAEDAGVRVVETYGLTESCGGVVYDGRPLADTEVRLDAEDAIELRGPTLMLGYRFDEEATRRAFTPDGWLRPGDAGRLEPDGKLRVIGRLDGLINSGGEKVWPQEVERSLEDHPKVAEVAIAGRSDPEWGERVVAFVIPRNPGDPPTLEELRAHAGACLPRHALPRELVLATELPRTAAGKVRRAALGEE